MKKFSRAKFYPVIVGAIVYFLAIALASLVAGLFGFALSYAERAVAAAEVVCFTEEADKLQGLHQRAEGADLIHLLPHQ